MFHWLIVHTVTTAALAAVVLTANRCFRLGPAARHLLWLVVLIKFLTPPVVYWPWALPTTGASLAPAVAPSNVGVRTVIIDMPPDFGPEPVAEGTPSLAPIAAAPVKAPPAATPFSWDELLTALCWTWLAGGVLVALLQAIRILRWRRRLAKGFPAPDRLEALVRDLAGAVGIRPPRLIVLPGPASPMIWCFGASRLIWPAGLEDRLSAEGCRAVLLHELAHLRRRDHWVGWLLLSGGCLWWWHPLFWSVRRRLSQEAELACDDYVVGVQPEARRAYAEALLEVSQRMSAAVAVPALGATGGRRDLERRLVMIMRGPASRRLSWIGLAGAVALGLLALPAWTLGEDKTTTPVAPAASYSPVAPPGASPAPPAPAPVASQPAAPGSNASKDPAILRDRKLKELEDRVQQLLKEMKELKGQTPAGGMRPANTEVQLTAQEALFGFLSASKPVLVTPPAAPAYPPEAASIARSDLPNTEVITLTRVSYKLKPAAAEALAAFLNDNVKTAILETKSEGETLVVTTTPDAQQAIGQFIHLLQGPGASTLTRPKNAPWPYPGTNVPKPSAVETAPAPPVPTATPPVSVPILPPLPGAVGPAPPNGIPLTPPAAPRNDAPAPGSRAFSAPLGSAY